MYGIFTIHSGNFYGTCRIMQVNIPYIHGSYGNCICSINHVSSKCSSFPLSFQQKVCYMARWCFQSCYISTREPWGHDPNLTNIFFQISWLKPPSSHGKPPQTCWSRLLHLSRALRKRRDQRRAVHHRHHRHHPEHMVEGNVASC